MSTLREIFATGGLECGNCSVWRRISENGMVEDCCFCMDEEFDLLDLDEEMISDGL